MRLPCSRAHNKAVVRIIIPCRYVLLIEHKIKRTLPEVKDPFFISCIRIDVKMQSNIVF